MSVSYGHCTIRLETIQDFIACERWHVITGKTPVLVDGNDNGK